VFSEILLNRKTAVRRVLELQRILREELTPIEILNDLGSNPEILLQTDEHTFQSILLGQRLWKVVRSCLKFAVNKGQKLKNSVRSFLIWDRTFQNWLEMHWRMNPF